MIFQNVNTKNISNVILAKEWDVVVGNSSNSENKLCISNIILLYAVGHSLNKPTILLSLYIKARYRPYWFDEASF